MPNVPVVLDNLDQCKEFDRARAEAHDETTSHLEHVVDSVPICSLIRLENDAEQWEQSERAMTKAVKA